jgi:thioredoxin-disulfide reductase
MTNDVEKYDVVIVGGGPAGLTAAIYAQRRGLKSLVLVAELGGQMAKITDIENWPGEDKINGATLALNTKNQAEKLGSKIVYEQAIKIEKLDNSTLSVKTTQKEFIGKTVILAFGKTPRALRVPGEEELMGKGVSYCVNCDGPLFKNKNVVIVGGGNSALDAAVMMSGIAREVHLIHRKEKFRGEEYMIKKVISLKNVTTHMSCEIKKINGTDSVKSVELSRGETLNIDGVFIEIGFIVNDSLVKGILKTDKFGQVMVDPHQVTSLPGVFAAGDLTNMPYQQLIIACGEGATAALSAFDYIQKVY